MTHCRATTSPKLWRILLASIAAGLVSLLGAGTATATTLAEDEPVAKGATVCNFQVAVKHDYYALAGGTPVLVHNADYGDLISRLGQIADRFGVTAREVKDAIHEAKMVLLLWM